MHITLSCSAAIPLLKFRNQPILRVIRTTGWILNLPSPDFRERENIMFAALVRFIQSWKAYNRSLSELSRLGDRELADIGISRSDIPRLAWKAAHQ
jgi:uncharacterized protein YjiS (DUF1127 family)